jgi:hypothetical protein
LAVKLVPLVVDLLLNVSIGAVTLTLRNTAFDATMFCAPLALVTVTEP